MSNNSGTFDNFMSGSPLNRLGWLRTSAKFVNASARSSRARWILFRSGDPLIHHPSGKLVELPTQRVGSILGPEPYFGQGASDGELASSDVKNLESARLRGPIAVFLGVWERAEGSGVASSSLHSGGEDEDTKIMNESNVRGDVYFALDVSSVDNALLESIQQGEGTEGAVAFASARAAASRLEAPYSAIFAGAKAMLEWNSRNRFCASCGSPVYSIWGGWKLACSSLLPWAQPREPLCPTQSGLHSHQHPRTDTVVITGVIDQTGDKMLLGWNRKFPGKFYSTLAGFVEPGETFEEAVAREVYEESGVRVYNVVYHSTQPWPYPGNLMVGCYAQADSTKPIRLDLDEELLDARWISRSEILEVLSHPEGTQLATRDYKKLDDIVSGEPKASQAAVANTEKNSSSEPPFRVPPKASIAGTLIAEWAYGRSKL